MKRKEALAELLAQVEAGTDETRFLKAATSAKLMFANAGLYAYVIAAYRGSLDAAKALHEAVLPEWVVHDFSQNSRSMGWNIVLASKAGLYVTSNEVNRVDFDTCPARAWLLAILRALQAMETDT